MLLIFTLFYLPLLSKTKETMEHDNAPFKFKHIREKNYDSSHPLYDAMKAICNPKDENCGHTAEYNGKSWGRRK